MADEAKDLELPQDEKDPRGRPSEGKTVAWETAGRSVYQKEKQNGTRNPDGSVRLKKLNARHRKLAQMVAEGCKLHEIHLETGYTYARISSLKKDPLVKQEIDRLVESHKDRIEGLFGKSVDAVADSLDPISASIDQRLKGVDRYIKLREQVVKERGGNRTAEDVIGQIINNGGTVNVQNNNGDKE